MTRGTLYYIFGRKDDIEICRSVEFNGNMYFNGYGWEVIDLLKNMKSNNPTDFVKKVTEFDAEHFKYQYDTDGYFQFYYDKPCDKKFNYFKVLNTKKDWRDTFVLIDGTSTYKHEGHTYDIFMSDHEFFRNATENTKVFIITKDAETITLLPGDVVDLSFMKKEDSVISFN